MAARHVSGRLLERSGDAAPRQMIVQRHNPAYRLAWHNYYEELDLSLPKTGFPYIHDIYDIHVTTAVRLKDPDACIAVSFMPRMPASGSLIIDRRNIQTGENTDMGMKINAQLPLPADLKAEYPLSENIVKIKERRDQEIRDVFTGRSDKFVVIVGPCSADNEDSVCEYVNRLAKVNEKVCDRLMIIPRIYTNKPRTTGEGYKGMLHQPEPDQAPDLLAGIIAIRKMHTRAIEESGLTAADEMLYPENRSYLDDILSYEAIGARSVENQQHRLTASGMDIPVGMKNPTSGDFSVMLNSVVAAQNSHTFIYRGMDVTTNGNELAHVILRGGVDKYGTCIPNYHYEDLVRLLESYQQRDLKNPAAIVDANHSNSNKQFREQIRIVSEVLHSRNYNPELKKLVKGVMIESYLEEGCQKIDENRVYGKSITDPCLGWEDTKRLIYKIAEEC